MCCVLNCLAISLPLSFLFDDDDELFMDSHTEYEFFVAKNRTTSHMTTILSLYFFVAMRNAYTRSPLFYFKYVPLEVLV